MPALALTVLKTIGGVLLSMLTSVILSPLYIKKMVMMLLDKLKASDATGPEIDKAIDEAEKIWTKEDPELK